MELKRSYEKWENLPTICEFLASNTSSSEVDISGKSSRQIKARRKSSEPYVNVLCAGPAKRSPILYL